MIRVPQCNVSDCLKSPKINDEFCRDLGLKGRKEDIYEGGTLMNE